MREAMEQSPNKSITVIDIVDEQDADSLAGQRLGDIDYERFIAGGDADYAWQMPTDGRQWR